MINRKAISMLRAYLSNQEITRLQKNSKKVQNVEAKYKSKAEKYYKELDKVIEESLKKTEAPPSSSKINFEELFTNLYFETLATALKEVDKKKPLRLAKKLPKGKTFINYAELLKKWDQYRKDKKAPKRQKVLADNIKKDYLEKIQKVWRQYSRSFRSGNIQQKEDIIEKMKQAGRTTHARAKTIVETETTNYYTQTKVEYYNRSEDVTHYLFVAIRDMATTKWCSTRNGIVYKKDSEEFRNEKPPAHWNCRSDVLPLTPQNPKHLKLIKEKSRQRENRKPFPLPKGWSNG